MAFSKSLLDAVHATAQQAPAVSDLASKQTMTGQGAFTSDGKQPDGTHLQGGRWLWAPDFSNVIDITKFPSAFWQPGDVAGAENSWQTTRGKFVRKASRRERDDTGQSVIQVGTWPHQEMTDGGQVTVFDYSPTYRQLKEAGLWNLADQNSPTWQYLNSLADGRDVRNDPSAMYQALTKSNPELMTGVPVRGDSTPMPGMEAEFKAAYESNLRGMLEGVAPTFLDQFAPAAAQAQYQYNSNIDDSTTFRDVAKGFGEIFSIPPLRVALAAFTGGASMAAGGTAAGTGALVGAQNGLIDSMASGGDFGDYLSNIGTGAVTGGALGAGAEHLLGSGTTGGTLPDVPASGGGTAAGVESGLSSPDWLNELLQQSGELGVDPSALESGFNPAGSGLTIPSASGAFNDLPSVEVPQQQPISTVDLTSGAGTAGDVAASTGGGGVQPGVETGAFDTPDWLNDLLRESGEFGVDPAALESGFNPAGGSASAAGQTGAFDTPDWVNDLLQQTGEAGVDPSALESGFNPAGSGFGFPPVPPIPPGSGSGTPPGGTGLPGTDVINQLLRLGLPLATIAGLFEKNESPLLGPMTNAANAAIRSAGAFEALPTPGLTPSQQRAITVANESVGGWKPYVDKAAAGLPGVDLNAYLNPYVTGALDVAAGKVSSAADKKRISQNASAGMRGAFGGSRHAVETGAVDRAEMETIGDLYKTGMFDAYDRATGLAGTDLNRTLSAGGAFGQLSGSDVDRLSGAGTLERLPYEDERKKLADQTRLYTGVVHGSAPAVEASTPDSTLGKLAGAFTALGGAKQAGIL